MRVSTYEIVVPLPEESSALLIHGLFGTVDLVTETIGNEIEKHRYTMNIENVFPVEIENTLLQRHHLTNQATEEELIVYKTLARKYEAINQERDKSPKFVILLSYDCNLRCKYCYQKGLGERIQPADKPVMSLRQAEQCLDIIESYPHEPARRTIELFGGEPLCAATFKTVEYIVKRASASGRGIAATTNGFELEIFADLLGPGRIEDIIVTLDGPARIHDRRRIGLHGRPTFDGIVSNISLALSRNVRVFLRVNLDASNINHLSELVSFIEAQGWFSNPDFTMYHALIKSFPGQEQPAMALHTSDVINYLNENDIYNPALARVGEKTGSVLESFITGNQVTTSHTRACGAVGTSLYLSPDGLIFGCHEAVGQPAFAIGHYDDSLHINEKEVAKWRSRRMPGIVGCENCPYVLLCAGGCAYRAIARGEPTAPCCDDYHESFVRTLQREYKLMNLLE